MNPTEQNVSAGILGSKKRAARGHVCEETPSRIELAKTGLQSVGRTSSQRRKCPRVESNHNLNLRRVTCNIQHTPRTKYPA